jgi:hypothetical protein
MCDWYQIPSPGSDGQQSHPMIFNMVETHTMKRSPSGPWNDSLRHSISICEVKLKILMETHELPLYWADYQFEEINYEDLVFCVVCVFSHFFSYLVRWFTSMTTSQVAVQNSSRSVLVWSIWTNNQLIVSFILCQGNLNFYSEKFLEPWYNLSSESESLWKVTGNLFLFLNLFFFFLNW